MLKVHRLGFVLGVIILLFGVSSTVWGQRGDWFEEEFDHRMPRGDWDYSDNWRVSSGVARTTSDGGFMYYPGPYDDMVLHTRLRWEADLNGGDGGGLCIFLVQITHIFEKTSLDLYFTF